MGGVLCLPLRGVLDLRLHRDANPARSSATQGVLLYAGKTLLKQPFPPPAHQWTVHAQFCGDRLVLFSLRRCQHDPGPDYAGFAQSEPERMYPSVAMFLAGCGGDAGTNPRCAAGLSETYGHLLATAVNDFLIERMAEPSEPVVGPIGAAFGEVTLKLDPAPAREEFVNMLPTLKGKELRKVRHQIAKIDAGESLTRSCQYPMHVWRFASGHSMIILSSEVVVDYSLRMKQTYGCDKTWVAAYANEHIAYIPSERVLKEGGYEGSDGMLECGFPAPFAAGVEGTVASGIEQLWEAAGRQLQALSARS